MKNYKDGMFFVEKQKKSKNYLLVSKKKCNFAQRI